MYKIKYTGTVHITWSCASNWEMLKGNKNKALAKIKNPFLRSTQIVTLYCIVIHPCMCVSF